jgi:signal transduction histidine kinase/CheY-like chemotaxis protein
MASTYPNPAPPCVSPRADAAQFQQFTRWVFWLCLIFGGVMLVAGLRLDDPRLVLMAAILLGHATITCTLVARARVRSLERAGLIMSMATLLSILAFTFVAPNFGSALVVATLVPAALALQHGRRQTAQMWFMTFCWLSAVSIGLIAEFHLPADAAGTWLDRGFRIIGIACANGIMLMLLWHAARRTWDHATRAEQAQNETLIAETRLRETETRFKYASDEGARLVAQLRDAQQLAVLGRLVGGVAQDFNNHLTSLVGYTELLLWDLPEESGKRQDVIEIRRAAERATLLTQQLLAFTEVAPPRPVIINLADVIMTSVRVLRRVLGADIRIVTALTREPGLVRADPTLLGYVLLNLGAQAREAMPDGGTLTVETTHLDVDVSASTHSDLRDWPMPLPTSTGADLLTGFVRVIVATTRRSDLPTQRIDTLSASESEPTRPTPPAQPTQPTQQPLGAAAIEDIVRESGGSVITSHDHAGDRITTIYLPRIVDADSAANVATVAPRGTETVLVVESERVVRDYVRTLLERHGYHAVLAETPREAFLQMQTARTPIDLAIVNLTLPDEGAGQFVRTLIDRRPGLRLLYMAHHLASARADLQQMPRSGFIIEKPFKANEFLICVRQALDSVPAERTFHIGH